MKDGYDDKFVNFESLVKYPYSAFFNIMYSIFTAHKTKLHIIASVSFIEHHQLRSPSFTIIIRLYQVINLSGMSTRDPAASHPVPLSDKPL